MKIISGAQTGVDRGALDAALELGLSCGGTVPRGRRAEDGRVPERYPVTEGVSAQYPERTERNVVDADATLILSAGEPSGGTLLTLELAKRHGRPFCVVDPREAQAAQKVRTFLERERPAVLNVAGPRESSQPGAQKITCALLIEVLR
ncbi:MAG: putative molybdenum carrier protein [Elusimicrobiota bacterium]